MPSPGIWEDALCLLCVEEVIKNKQWPDFISVVMGRCEKVVREYHFWIMQPS